MERAPGHGAIAHAPVIDAVRAVRLRWRLRRALVGASFVVAGSFAMLLAASYALDALRYGALPVVVVRLVVAVAILALVVAFLVRPLRAPADERRIALYFEEREPSLGGAVLTTVDSASGPPRDAAVSPALLRRLAAVAASAVRDVDDGRRVEAGALLRSVALFAGVSLLSLGAVLLGPAVLRHGARLLLVPWDASQPVSLYGLDVAPGDTTVARGGDQLVSARLRGFQSDSAQLLVRRSDSATFAALDMRADGGSARFTYRLLNVTQPLEYAVVANGVRSRVYRLRVADLPFVKELGLDYRFPAYTGLPAQHVDQGGDVAAPRGTLVTVRVTATMPTSGGRLVMDAGDTLQLARGRNGELLGVMRVERPGFYKVQLQAVDGRMLDASLDYTIDILPDRPPTIAFTKPGADARVLAVDEVPLELHAEDDYGVQRVELFYSVNGGPERRVSLFDAGAKRTPATSADYTLSLESFRLQPGDVVSYYARATDNDAADGAHMATTDIYFLQVRPYAQDYRQDQSGGGGGGGSQADSPGRLTQIQRDIIAGTFKADRDRADTPPRELSENLATLRLAQQRLREQVQQLASRLVQRGIAAQDSGFARIAQILPRAAAAMDSAERKLASADASGALPSEQRALAELQRAEAAFRDVRVSMGGGGGGGGGGPQSSAQDLADLFDMNRDKLRNQYETVNRGGGAGSGGSDAQVDSTLEKLRQLAARQQQENERAQRKLDSLRIGAPGSTSGEGQRQLAQQAEQTARQLERLARERSSPQMADAARRLQDAANEMRRSAASGNRSSASGRAALDRLETARRLVEQQRGGDLQRNVTQALDDARRLQSEEQQVASAVGALQNDPTRYQRMRTIQQTKSAMADRTRALENQLGQLSDDARRTGSMAAGKLAEAASSMRDRRVEEKVRASGTQLPYSSPQSAQAMESQIGADLGEVARRIEAAAGQAGTLSPGGQQQQRQQQRQQQIAKALDRTRQLVSGMERQQGSPSGSPPGSPSGSPSGSPPGSPSGSPGAPAGRALQDAEDLRGDLARAGVETGALDRAITDLRALATQSRDADPRVASDLRAQAVEDLKAFAFDLGRSLQQESDRVLVGRSADVPERYRRAVEAYYRALGSTPRR